MLVPAVFGGGVTQQKECSLSPQRTDHCVGWRGVLPSPPAFIVLPLPYPLSFLSCQNTHACSYLVVYEDGDREDLEWHEILRYSPVLVPGGFETVVCGVSCGAVRVLFGD